VNTFLDILDRLSRTILDTFKRFPLASLSAFLVSLILILFIEFESSSINKVYGLLGIKLAFVLSLGIFLFPVFHLLNRSIWFKLIGVALLGGYFYFLPLEIEPITILRHILLVFALSFMFFWAPFFNIDISNKNIWEWTMKILLVLLSTILLTLTIYIVFYLLIYYLHKLFGLEILDKRYLEFIILVLGLFSVNFFLFHLPKYICLLQLKQYTRVGEVFTKYILTPVTILYLLVLSAYILKILVFGMWEELLDIDWLVIGYSFFAIITYMFWTPLVDNFPDFFKELIWKPLLLLSFILAFSILLRVADGVDLNSLYLLIVFDIWLGGISIYFLYIEKASYKWLFFSISLLIVLSQSEYVVDFLLKLVDTNF